jgi:hypothetical protein
LKSFIELKHSLNEASKRFESEYIKKLKTVANRKSESEDVILVNGFVIKVTKLKSELFHKDKLVSVIDKANGLINDGYQLPNVRPFSEYEKIQNFEDLDQLVKMIKLGKTRQQIVWNKL